MFLNSSPTPWRPIVRSSGASETTGNSSWFSVRMRKRPRGTVLIITESTLERAIFMIYFSVMMRDFLVKWQEDSSLPDTRAISLLEWWLGVHAACLIESYRDAFIKTKFSASLSVVLCYYHYYFKVQSGKFSLLMIFFNPPTTLFKQKLVTVIPNFQYYSSQEFSW